MSNHLDQQDDLEFNDGLGDMLREKSVRQFSWTKTTFVLVALIVAVFIGLTATFKLSAGFLASSGVSDDGDFSDKKRASVNLVKKDAAIHSTIDKSKKTIGLASKHAKPPASKQVKDAKSGNKSNATTTKKVASKTAPTKSVASYKLIAGSFGVRDNAVKQQKSLKNKGVSSFIRADKTGKKTLYLVQVGAFSDVESAKKQAKILKSKKIQAYVIKQ